MTGATPRCDIYCRVVDNFGDAGVCWRLARQLAAEEGWRVRLFIDRPGTLEQIAPDGAAGVEVLPWQAGVPAAGLVIEAFGCEVPEPVLHALASQNPPPVWINLEYLSAEPWVASHHLLASPHPMQRATKHFFFPGFTPATGGLLRERGLLARRDAMPSLASGRPLSVLVFAYDDAPVADLIVSPDAGRAEWHVMEGGLAAKLQHWRGLQGKNALQAAPMLEFDVLPFVPLDRFDDLLWQHDILFVRGEDSFVRAQWAAKPFIWQAYRQADDAHRAKLEAFLDLYCAGLDVAAAAAVREMWQAWNFPGDSAAGPAWSRFLAVLPELRTHAQAWSAQLAEMPSLAANLLSFYRKTAKI